MCNLEDDQHTSNTTAYSISKFKSFAEKTTSSIFPKLNLNGQYWRYASHTLVAAIKCKLTKHQSQTGNKQSIS